MLETHLKPSLCSCILIECQATPSTSPNNLKLVPNCYKSRCRCRGTSQTLRASACCVFLIVQHIK